MIQDCERVKGRRGGGIVQTLFSISIPSVLELGGGKPNRQAMQDVGGDEVAHVMRGCSGTASCTERAGPQTVQRA